MLYLAMKTPISFLSQRRVWQVKGPASIGVLKKKPVPSHPFHLEPDVRDPGPLRKMVQTRTPNTLTRPVTSPKKVQTFWATTQIKGRATKETSVKCPHWLGEKNVERVHVTRVGGYNGRPSARPTCLGCCAHVALGLVPHALSRRRSTRSSRPRSALESLIE